MFDAYKCERKFQCTIQYTSNTYLVNGYAQCSVKEKSPHRITTCCAAILSSDESRSATTEMTAVQSVQVSAAAKARRVEKKKALRVVEVTIML